MSICPYYEYEWAEPSLQEEISRVARAFLSMSDDDVDILGMYCDCVSSSMLFRPTELQPFGQYSSILELILSGFAVFIHFIILFVSSH